MTEPCTLCERGANCISNLIRNPISGTTGGVLFVGSEPDRYEDMENELGVGRFAAVREQVTRDAGLDISTDGVDYTTAVRCASSDNPTPHELDACRVHLGRIIHELQPRGIIALGEPAFRALCKQAGMKSKRGQDFPLHATFGYECTVYPTYSTGMLFKSPQARATILADIRRARAFIFEGDAVEEESYTVWDSTEDADIVSDTPIAYDIETLDEEGKIVPEPTQMAVATEHGAYVTTDVFEMLASIEAPQIVSHFGLWFDDTRTGLVTTRDTAVLAYLDDETQPLGLESLCVKYMGSRGWKTTGYAALGTRELMLYNVRDAKNTLDLYHTLLPIVGDRIGISDYLITPFHRCLQRAQARGVFIHQPAVTAAKSKYEQKRAAACERAAQLSGWDNFQAQRIEMRRTTAASTGTPVAKKDLKTKPFNPGSNDQVGDLLTARGYSLEQTPTKKWKVDKGTLSLINEPFADAIIDYRNGTKMLSTYVKPYALSATRNGRIHAEYDVMKVTGRTSAANAKDGEYKGEGANTQNLPREHKNFFGAPSGYNLVSADYSTIEFRIGAMLAGEQTVLGNYATNPKWDPHTFFASHFYGVPESAITREQRQVAKSAVFSQLYLGTAGTIQTYAQGLGLDLPWSVCVRLHRMFHAVFPGFVPWYHVNKGILVTQGYAESLTGRRRHFGDIGLLSREGKAAALREFTNFLVQSLTLDIAAAATIEADAAGIPINLFIHDSISAEVDKEETSRTSELLVDCMVQRAPAYLQRHFGVTLNVPLVVDVTVTEGASHAND
jgi:uracil-DNA glycosylase family 4